MTQLFNSMKALITSEMINKASTVLNEKHADVSNGVSTIIPSLLSVLSKKGHSPQIKNILEKAGNLDIESKIKNIFAEKPTENQQNIGDDFLQHLLGDKAADFTNPIAAQTGMNKVAVNELISMVAPVVVGFLGKKMVDEKLTMHQLVAEIDKEKGGFEGLIPAELIKTFNLKEHKTTTSAAATHSQPTTTRNTENKPEKPSGGKSWIWWIILLIALLLLFFWWRSCKGHKEQVNNVTQEVVATVQPVIDSVKVKTAEIRTPTELTLPDGTKLHAYPGGVEDRMITFLQSDEYKNSTEETLKNKWFEFDNIDFVFGSSTELKSGSQTQLNNIIAILKNFKEAKVKIGAYSDVIGSDEANLRISHDRAKTIESLFDKGGVGAQVVKIQGYGEEFAKHSASEPDTARAKDRDIAIRFVK